MRKLLTLVFALLAGPVFAQNMGQVGGLNVPAAAGSSGTVTSVACPSATITTSGTCNPLAAGATAGQVVTASGSTGATVAQTGLVFTGGNSLQVGNGSNAGTVFLDTTGGGGVNLLAGSSASTFSATLPDNTGTVAELNLAQTFTAAQTNSTAGAASTPALSLTGVIFTGGSGSTTTPQLLIQPSNATASSVWSTTGTAFGINVHTGTANLIDAQLDGLSVFHVTSVGAMVISNSFTASGAISSSGGLSAGTASFINWTSRGILSSPAIGGVQLGNTDAAAPVAQTLSAQSVVAGTASNVAGAAELITGSRGVGSGGGGSITIETAIAHGSDTVQDTLLPALTLDAVQHTTAGNTTNPPTCGAGCASISATSTDQRMTVTTGTAATSVVVNFGKTWLNAPVCVSETASATNLSGITAISASSITIGVATALTTAPIYIVCG